MADKAGKSSKKKRDKKVSTGTHGGGGKVTLSNLDKVLFGGGALRRIGVPADKLGRRHLARLGMLPNQD